MPAPILFFTLFLMFIAGTRDASGFRQYQEVGRHGDLPDENLPKTQRAESIAIG